MMILILSLSALVFAVILFLHVFKQLAEPMFHEPGCPTHSCPVGDSECQHGYGQNHWDNELSPYGCTNAAEAAEFEASPYKNIFEMRRAKGE